jgi:co-chaperonin GroES (HSP10)
MKLLPQFDYVLCEPLKAATGVVTTTDIGDHWQKYKILAIGQGRYIGEQDKWLPIDLSVGDVIWVQKHAEADTPDELKTKGQYLIQASRVMAVEVAK